MQNDTSKGLTNWLTGTNAAGKFAVRELLGGIGFDHLLSIAASSLGNLLGSYDRDMGYASNRDGPRSTPPPDSILRSFWSGRMGNPNSQNARDELLKSLSEHGIATSAGITEHLTRRGRAWDNHISLSRPLLPLDFYIKAYRFGQVGPVENGAIVTIGELTDRMKREGIYDVFQQNLLQSLPDSLSMQEIFALWASGIIGEDEVKRLMRYNGQVDDKQLAYLMSLYEVPNLAEALTLRNREVIDDAELVSYLGRMGFRRREEKERLAGLRFEIPGPSDLVRFAVRHVFEPSVAEHYGFNQEISNDFVEWHKKQGFGQQFDITDPFNGQQYSMNWAQAHWLAHWVWPSPTQAYTMLHRLRATGGVNGGPRDASGLVFTQDDLNKLLRGNDYPPYWRPYLGNISYRMLEVDTVKRCWQVGLFDDKEAVERYQDVGYTKDNAQVLLDMNKQEVTWQRVQKSISRIRFKTLAAYKAGIISRQTAGVQLYGLALPNLSAWKAYTELPLANQQQIASDDKITQGVLDTIDTDLELSLANKAIAAIHKAYLRLDIDDNSALQALLNIGVFQQRAQEYISSWKWEMYGRGKSLSVGQLVKSFVRGVITQTVFVLRLMKLGYSQPDALALLALASQDQQLYLARLQEQSAKSLARQQKAILDQQKALQKQLKDAAHRLAKSASPAKLLKWYKKGYIPQSEFDLRLAVLGILPEDIHHYEQEASSGK